MLIHFINGKFFEVRCTACNQTKTPVIVFPHRHGAVHVVTRMSGTTVLGFLQPTNTADCFFLSPFAKLLRPADFRNVKVFR